MRDRDAEKLLVKERVSIADLAREVVADLEQRGHELWACCPFHAEDTPSFHVRPALGVYKCFGCGEAGDVFSFVQKTRGVGFREALEILAERAGVELGSLTPEERRRSAEAREQREVLATALDVFRKAMGRSGRHALEYLQGRGFTRETLLAWDVGFIPSDLTAALRSAGLTSGQIEGAGFTRAFGDRVGFGIRDAHGALVGFGARLLGDTDGPKYVNTRETPRFNKGRLLYGLHKASAALARTRRLVVMEGYTDVMMAHQAGLDEAVATMGTSFTADHLELVTSRVANLVLVFDGDEAGERAAERAVNMLLEQGRECRVLMLPEGQDPCDWFSSRGRDEFEELLARDGLSSVAFLARRGLQKLDAGQPGGREAVAREVLAATGRLRDPLRREGVLAEIARVCGVDRNILRRTSAPAAGVDDGPPGFAGGGAPVRGGRPVSARVRTQFVAVAGLAAEAGADAELADLERAGALDHPGARRLLALGRQVAGGDGRADATDWLAAAREAESPLAEALERVLLPPPDLILPTWAEAVAYLRAEHERQTSAAARRELLARPDLARDPERLKDLEARLKAARNPAAHTGRAGGTGRDAGAPGAHPGTASGTTDTPSAQRVPPPIENESYPHHPGVSVS